MIKIGPDVGAPLVVTAIDLVGESTFPKYSNWLTYGMTIVGYAAGFLNYGGDFVKNIGVTSLPLTAKRIYDAVRSPAAVSKGLAYHTPKVSRYPGSAQSAPFQGVKLT